MRGLEALLRIAAAAEDRARGAMNKLTKQWKDAIDVPNERVFIGLDAFQKALECGIDLVVMASPPGFRPAQYLAAVNRQ